MADADIIELYWERNPDAIALTAEKYGSYLKSVANRILSNSEDVKECVNDAYLSAWNAIPPLKPQDLKPVLAKFARQAAIDRWRSITAEKRGHGELTVVLDELEACVEMIRPVEAEYEVQELKGAIQTFLKSLSRQERQVFMRRYWFIDTIQTISQKTGYSQTKITSMLYRTRKKLQRYLKKEGYYEHH